MPLHVTSKKIALSGVLLALNILVLFLSDIITFNTLWLLALSAFFVGIIIRELGLRIGFAYLIAAVALSLFLITNKLHCLTFAAMAGYILLDEWFWQIASKISLKHKVNAKVLHWSGKLIYYNIVLILIIIFMPSLIYGGEISVLIRVGIWAGGQVLVVIYDKAYSYFQNVLWTKWRKMIIK